MAEQERRNLREFLFSRTGLALAGFLAVAGFLLWEEHRVHILGFLPLVLILGLCLGMHFLMHGGHAGDHGSRRDESGRDDE